VKRREDIMDKVSVIVPVYNSAKYLRKCVDSILCQTHEKLEIILVNDASEDGKSAEICREYEQKYSKIKYIELPAMIGIAGTRNAGIEAAAGKYVMFVDSDDYLPDEDVISELYIKSKESASDIAVGNYVREIKGKLIDAGRHGFSESSDTGSPEFRYRGFFSNGILSYVWGKLYLVDFLKKYEIRFDDLAYAEDKLFNIKCFYNSPGYCFTDRNVYCYRLNPYSESHIYRKNFDENWMNIAELAYKELKKCPCPDEYEDVIGYTVLFATFFHAKQEYRFKNKSVAAMCAALRKYEGYELAQREFCRCGSYVRNIRSGFWRKGIKIYSFLMKRRYYGLAAFGILVAAVINLDGALSSTGTFARKT